VGYMVIEMVKKANKCKDCITWSQVMTIIGVASYIAVVFGGGYFLSHLQIKDTETMFVFGFIWCFISVIAVPAMSVGWES